MTEDFLNITQLQSYTVEEFQKDFDNLMNKVESGESFVITSEYGDAVMVPYTKDVEEIIRIHTELNNDAS
jgi:5,10-methylenetetrahydrofolate reductase